MYKEEAHIRVIGTTLHLIKQFGDRFLQLLSDNQKENIKSTTWDPDYGYPIMSINNMINEV